MQVFFWWSCVFLEAFLVGFLLAGPPKQQVNKTHQMFCVVCFQRKNIVLTMAYCLALGGGFPLSCFVCFAILDGPLASFKNQVAVGQNLGFLFCKDYHLFKRFLRLRVTGGTGF